jgi:hypothetical protein
MEEKRDFTGQLQVGEFVGSGWTESWPASARRARRRRQQLGEGGGRVAAKQQLRSGNHHLDLRASPPPCLQRGELLPPDATERHIRPHHPGPRVEEVHHLLSLGSVAPAPG